MSAYSEIGPKLVERGYAALPVAPGTKVPGSIVGGSWTGMNGWSTRYVERLPTDIEVDHWSRWIGAGVCVVTGDASRHLVGVDIDVDDVPIVAAIKALLPFTPVRKAGQKGETLFFRSATVGSRSFSEFGPDGRQRRRLCDVIGPGRQTVLPPSIHMDTGQPYRWIGEAALENVDPDDLPELPDDILERLAEALAPFGYRERPPSPERGMVETDNPFRAVNEAALGNFDAWVPKLGLYGLRHARGGYEAVPTWRASSTGKPVERRKRNLKIHAAGIRDMGADEGYTPLDLVMVANGCDFDTALGQMMGWLGLAGFEIDLQPEATHQHLDDGSIVDLETGEITMPTGSQEIASPEPARSEKIDFVAEILASRCLVGEIARWVLHVSRRPQPRLAIAAALALVGTASSRQMQTPTHSNLNLFLLLTARSGMGKDTPLKAVGSILAASRLMDMIGPAGAASDVGLLDYARMKPASVMPIDEFGDLVGSMSSQRASSHSLNIMAVMRRLWDGGMIGTTHALTRRSTTLANPCISMICASTPAQFYDAIGSTQVLNGFLNRFLLFQADDRAQRGSDDRSILDVPVSITDGMTAIAERPAGLNKMRFRLMADNLLDEDRPYKVPWATESARLVWQRYEDFNLDRSANDERLEAFAPRCPQNALRVATILAVAENVDDPRVTERNIDIGIDVAEASLRDMLKGYNDHVPESAGAALAAKALQRIKDAGGSMSRRVLLRSMQRAFKNVRELDDMMRTLIEAGDVATSSETPIGGGTATTTYHSVR